MITDLLIAFAVGTVAGAIGSGLQLWLADRRSKKRKRDIMKGAGWYD